jgi:TPP-dependent indolepyruvate ferredoxin oxidoreductase alpha subunit
LSRAALVLHVAQPALTQQLRQLEEELGAPLLHRSAHGVLSTDAGQAAFSKVPHVFQSLGDGTYFHSGYLAVRAAVSARVNITYKILYNDAVAMTGGQPVDGQTSVPMIAQQMATEGVKRIALVTEDLSRYAVRTALRSPAW